MTAHELLREINKLNSLLQDKLKIERDTEEEECQRLLKKKDMQDIMRPILQAALPKARIQKHFPRKLVYGTLMYEGVGVCDPSASQVIEHVHSLIRHSFQVLDVYIEICMW